MILSDSEIRAAIRYGQIVVDPMPPEINFTTSALDLTLSDKQFKIWKSPAGSGISIFVNPSQPAAYKQIAAQFLVDAPIQLDDSIIIEPKNFLLALTHERIELPESSRIAARVEGRSSLARLGLGVHVTAPTIHAGFKGNITLEITNHGVFPIKLKPGMRICQLVFEMVFGTPSAAMTGSFQDQNLVTGKP